MNTAYLLPLAAALIALPSTFTRGQSDTAKRTVRIEIVRTENGHTEREVIELPMGDEQAVEEALRQAKLWEELELINGENVVLDVRRMRSNGGVLKDMCLAFTMPEGAVPKGKLGVYSETADAGEGKGGTNGARVTNVVNGSAAERAGLREGDVITAIGDAHITGPDDLLKVVRTHAPGDIVKIYWTREGRKMNAKATLDAAEPEWTMAPILPVPPSAPYVHRFDLRTVPFDTISGAFLGVVGEDLEGSGARITEVTEGSAAETMGIKEDDVIVEVDGSPVSGFSDLAVRIGAHEPGDKVRIGLLRGGVRQDLEGTLGERRSEFMWAFDLDDTNAPFAPGMPGTMPGERRQLQAELDELRREMEQLRHELRGDVMRRTTVLMTTVDLSPSEQEMLVKHGATGLSNRLELPGLVCYPNPSQGTYQLRFDVPERGDLIVDVHNGSGDRVYHETITGFKGRYERMLDLSDLANGPYFLVISQGGRSVARKLMKQ